MADKPVMVRAGYVVNTSYRSAVVFGSVLRTHETLCGCVRTLHSHAIGSLNKKCCIIL